jgi:hypothetical protein
MPRQLAAILLNLKNVAIFASGTDIVGEHRDAGREGVDGD